MEIQAGSHVEVINARGERTERVAVTPVVQGRDFPVVRVSMLDEYEAAVREERSPDSVAWPAEDVHPLEAAR